MIFEFLESILSRKSHFNEIETLILEAVESTLDERIGYLFRRQIEGVNKIQRLSGGREVNCYRMYRGKPVFDESFRITRSPGEFLMATIQMQLPNTEKRLRADIWLVDGFFFSIEFERSVKSFVADRTLNGVKPNIVSAKIDSSILRADQEPTR